MDKQRELLNKAVLLAQAYPDVQIHVCVDNDEIAEDFRWTSHHISKVELGEWATYNEKIFVDKSDYFDEVEWMEDIELTEEELDAAFAPAILIYTRA